jgi:hypothetical protein
MYYYEVFNLESVNGWPFRVNDSYRVRYMYSNVSAGTLDLSEPGILVGGGGGGGGNGVAMQIKLVGRSYMFTLNTTVTTNYRSGFSR